jgi:hypothetical protein
MRRAFGLIDQVAETAAAGITEQVRTTVSDAQISALLDRLLPNSVPGVAKTARSRSIAEGKRVAIQRRYRGMWSDYAGTEFGILQAIDTASRWDFKKSGDKQENNMRKVVAGEFDTNMRAAKAHLAAVRT